MSSQQPSKLARIEAKKCAKFLKRSYVSALSEAGSERVAMQPIELIGTTLYLTPHTSNS